MHIKSEVFEGKRYRNLVKKLFKKKRYYKGIDINKFVLADIATDFYIKNKKKNFFFKIYNYLQNTFSILKIVIKIFFFKTVLHFEYKGNLNIWFLYAPTKRPSLKKKLIKDLKSKKIPHYVSWKNEINFYSFYENFKRLKFYFNNLLFNNFNFIDFKKNLLINYDILKLSDLEKDFNKQIKPKSVLSMKDFQRFENGIMQISNLKNVPTFTTQHSVHHYFIKKNERIGNMMLSNSVSKNILCWGEFNLKIYKYFNPQSNIFLTGAYLRPKKISSNVISSKISLIICLACNRRLPETIAILKKVNKISKFIDEFNIIIRLHPSVNFAEYKKFINNFNLNFKYTVEFNKGEFIYSYKSNSIFITGLSGVYYDLIYLGYKTIFYKFPYDLFEELPRVLKPCKNEKDILNQINKLAKLKNSKWKKISKKIVKKTLNHNILEVNDRSIIKDVFKIIEKNKNNLNNYSY